MVVVRFHPPDMVRSWWTRARDGVQTRQVPPRAEGVEYGFLDRVVDRTSSEIVEQVEAVEVLGGDMLHVETVASLPEEPHALREVCGELTRRLRFGQVQPDGTRAGVAYRWIEFRPGPAGTLRIIARLERRVDAALSTYVELGGGPTAWSRLGSSRR